MEKTVEQAKEQMFAVPIVHLVNAQTTLAGLVRVPEDQWAEALERVRDHLMRALTMVQVIELAVRLRQEGVEAEASIREMN